MTELIGDRCEPSEIVVPQFTDGRGHEAGISAGYLFISGDGKLWFHDLTGMVVVTSS